MNFRCSELQGVTHQPKEILEIDNCWIIPACKAGPVLTSPDQKLIFVYQEDMPLGEGDSVEYLFVCCYQFLFCNYHYIYGSYALRQLNHLKSFVLNGTGINDVEKQIRNKYGQLDTVYGKELFIDFMNIDSQYKTWLPHTVNFKEVFEKFAQLYEKDDKFKEIITLFCETTNGLKPLYNNVLQQIAQLQTIFEALIGQPKESICEHCGKSRYVEEWDVFLEKRLKEYGIADLNTSLIIKIKKILNRKARIEFVHSAGYYNPYDLRGRVAIQTNEHGEYNADIHEVLSKKSDSWNDVDWMNVYSVYSVIVRNLIYGRYFSLAKK
jgi:hypothetical protein